MGRYSATFAIILIFCSFGFPIGIQAQNSYWDVVSIHEDADTLLVGLRVDRVMYCGEPHCPRTSGSLLIVSPCPLDKECSGDEYRLQRTTDAFEVTYVKLLRGIHYSFSGSWGTSGSYDFIAETYPCYRSCTVGAPIPHRIFPDEYTSTNEYSWGAIKSLFK